MSSSKVSKTKSKKLLVLISTILVLSLFFVSNFAVETVSFAATPPIRVVATIHAGRTPTYLAYNPSDKDMYVVSCDARGGACNGSVLVIDSSTNKVAAKIRIGENPTG